MKKFEHCALANLRIGDSVVFTEHQFPDGEVTRIIDGPHTAGTTAGFVCGGRHVEASFLYHYNVLVIPRRVRKELRELIQAQPKDVRKTLAVVRCFNNGKPLTFTIANIGTGERLYSRITITESASMEFETEPRSGAWYEGRPSVEECHTEYCIGDHILATPDTFDPVLYT
jgi:hypothetical protein